MVWCYYQTIFTAFKFCENSILEDNFNNTISLTKALSPTLWHRGIAKIGKKILLFHLIVYIFLVFCYKTSKPQHYTFHNPPSQHSFYLF